VAQQTGVPELKPVVSAVATGGRPRPRGNGPGILLVGASGNGTAGDINLSVDRNFYIAVRKQE
jgi:hypothetical protein